MSFALPHVLWLLALPAALLAWEFLRRRGLSASEHPKILRAEAGLRSVSLSADPGSAAHGGRRRFLLCAALALGIVALARPQWGRIDEPVFDQSRDIIIAMDLSRSMLTPDVKPSRLERSKLLIQALLDRLKGERVGLIVFSGTAFLQAPVSSDYEILRDFLPALGPDYLPEGGTNYRQLLDTAVEEFGTGSSADRFLIILSDGEATDDNWREQVPELERKGIKVIGLGVGTEAGGMIPDGSGGFMKDENGAVVLSKLEGGTLKDLAAATHGEYRDASQWVDIAKVLDDTVEAGRKGRFVEHNSVRLAERYQWALAQALVCLVASFWLEFPVRPKSRELRISPAGPARPRAAAAAALMLLLALLPRGLSADATAPDPSASLSKVVGRLAEKDDPSGLDWAELGRDTATWGQHVQSAGQQVPEGPVRDALRAVDLGEKADPRATDWKKLRSDLEALLRKEEPPKDDQKQQKQDQQKDEDKQQDSQQDKGGGQQQKQDESRQEPPKAGDGQPQPRSGQSPRPDTPKQGEPGSKSPESAFGDMKQGPTPEPTPRQSQQAMQRVGGERKDEAPDPARRDPALAIPLEKLEQVKNGDSPAELFQMIRRNEPITTPVSNGKNW
jgi:Ca-activated chloride channel family protein